MNRKLVVALAAVFGLAMTMGNDVAWSQGRGGGQSGGGGGYSRGSGGHGAQSGGGGGYYRGSGGHGGHYYGGSHYSGRYGGYYGAGIYLGSSLLWGWPWYGGHGHYPYYSYYPYGGYPAYDPAPTVYVESDQPASPLAEAAPAPQNFWYYCTNPAGYYPYVKSCSVPWKQVVPTPPPAESGK